MLPALSYDDFVKCYIISQNVTKGYIMSHLEKYKVKNNW